MLVEKILALACAYTWIDFNKISTELESKRRIDLNAILPG